MDLREQFVITQTKLRNSILGHGHILEKKWETRRKQLSLELRTGRRRKPLSFSELAQREEFTREYEAYILEGRRLLDIAHAAEERLTQQLEDLASKMPIEVSPDVCSLVDVVSSLEYSSQGYGARKYAEDNASRKAEELEALGLPTHIRVRHDRFEGTSRFSDGGYTNYEIWAQADPITLAVARRRPPRPLREAVKSMLLRHCNPRVVFPFLPHGYEQSVGLDYFGNDLEPATVEAAG